jgi:hypothetical protein
VLWRLGRTEALDGYRLTTVDDVATDKVVAACGGATFGAPVAVGDSEESDGLAPLLLQSGSALILPFFAGSEFLFPLVGLGRVWCPACLVLGRG